MALSLFSEQVSKPVEQIVTAPIHSTEYYGECSDFYYVLNSSDNILSISLYFV